MTKAMRVLFISFDGLTDPLGQSQILPYLCGLSSEEISITILSLEKSDRYKLLKEVILQKCQTHNIEWVPLAYRKQLPLFSQVANARALIRHAITLHKQKSFSLTHCRSYLSALAGLKLKNKYGVRFLFDMRGFWADERVEGGIWNISNPVYLAVYKYFKKKEREFLTKADHVVSLTYNAKHEIESWPFRSAPVSVIPTCVDLDLFNPDKIIRSEIDRARRSLRFADDENILLYLGSWGSWYLTDDMLKLFEALRAKGVASKFLILTFDNVDLSSVRHPEDIIVRAVQRNEVPVFISLAKMAVCFVKPTFSKKASSATKVGEILAMNVPVLINHGWGDVDKLYASFPDHIRLISAATEEFANFDAEAAIDVRSKLKEQLSLEKGVSSYRKIYQLLT